MTTTRTQGPKVSFRVDALVSMRLADLQNKLSLRARTATRVDAFRTAVLLGLAVVVARTAKPPWGELRRLSSENLGAGAKKVAFGLDAPAKRCIEAFRGRLSTPRRRVGTSAALRTLVLVGLDCAERLPSSDLGRTACKTVESAASTWTTNNHELADVLRGGEGDTR